MIKVLYKGYWFRYVRADFKMLLHCKQCRLILTMYYNCLVVRFLLAYLGDKGLLIKDLCMQKGIDIDGIIERFRYTKRYWVESTDKKS